MVDYPAMHCADFAIKATDLIARNAARSSGRAGASMS
jgi:hypothetical protein